MVFQLICRDAVRPGLAAIAAFACVAFAPGAARAQNAILTWNQELLAVTQQTSGFLLAGPPDVAMQMAIVDNAMYDAVNVTSGNQYQAFAYSAPAAIGASSTAAALTAGYQALFGVYSASAWTSSATNNRASAITGAGGVLDQITATYSTAMAALGSSQAVTDGVAAGTAAANATLARLNGTGPGSATYAMINGLTPQSAPGSGSTPGVYVPPSATGGRPEMYPLWGTVGTVGISAAQLQTVMASVTLPGVTNPAASAAGQVQQSIASAAYAMNLLQTECAGSGVALSATVAAACAAANTATSSTLFSPQTLAQNQAALFWNDPGTTIQPPGHWLQIADNVLAGSSLSLMEQARVSAAMSTAIVDAGIAAWGDKYVYNLWRPITAIRSCDTSTGYSWNSTLTAASCATNWTSLIATPPHPDYVAGHPAFSGAAATVLTDLLGGSTSFSSSSNSYCNGGTPGFAADGYTIVSCTLATATAAYAAGTYTIAAHQCNSISLGTSNANDSPLICAMTISFANFFAASQGPLGSEYSRVVGGIHTPFAVSDALSIGNSIGALVLASNFAAVPEPSAMLVLATAGFGLLGAARRRRTNRGN